MVPAVAVNVAVVLPATTVTEAGTINAPALPERLTVPPPVFDTVTVQGELPPDPRLAGAHASELSTTGATSEIVAVCVIPFSAAPVDSRFAATLFLHEYARGDEEFSDRIVRFWAGDPLPVADLRRRLKEAGAAATYRLAAIKERDLSVQRFRFVARLTQAAGYAGWVVLLDEAELIGRYTSLQRAKSYAEIARWVKGDREDPAAPLCAVLTTVDDFE